MLYQLKYLETYAEARVPHRKIFTTWESAKKDLEPWWRTNISVSVWWYKEIEQRYNSFGNPTRKGPKYSTAITDRMFFDIDCLTPEGKFIYANYRGMQKLWKYAEKYDLRREVAFTGGGYQMTIAANIHPYNYSAVVKDFVKKVGVVVDPAMISLVSMRRYIGSINHGGSTKSKRNNFCISLKDYEINLPFSEHRRLSQTQRKGINYYGTESYKPPKVATVMKRRELDRRTTLTFGAKMEEILEMYGYTYKQICPNIRAIIEQPRVGHLERMMVIKYLKTILRIKYGDMLLLLPKLLTNKHGSGNDGSHSIEEGQVASIYSRNLEFNPEKMRLDGYCTADCTKCDSFIRDMRELWSGMKKYV